ncbi:PP2C family protein-serine/threonine phosphatase [Acanthopleuribacter pedis]|uniref:PPM-type phosphatase domain-containing protein n=1 Tax=Acanthopleuribacter pedis TaxID=442870 RepID=A0A8J7U1J9_9BACT|nr:hypothetical protein [Acanthopleuribacter pedis]MBO1318273.1 hypothetical protein [Acanthopleuribacter pedis]
MNHDPSSWPFFLPTEHADEIHIVIAGDGETSQKHEQTQDGAGYRYDSGYILVANEAYRSPHSGFTSYLTLQRASELLDLTRSGGRRIWPEIWRPRPENGPEEMLRGMLQRTFERVHETVIKFRAYSENYAGTETSLLGAIIEGNTLVFGYLGDIRLYHLREHQLRCLTQDHSLAMGGLASGEIEPEDYECHPNRETLVKYLGGNERYRPTQGQIRLRAGDRVLICTKGLYSALNEEDLRHGLESPQIPAEERARHLVRLAKGTGSQNTMAAVTLEITAVSGKV